MSVRFLRAEELARFAGVAKSTVLAAIRRGDIVSSRTVGRGTRISVDAARTYLGSRNCPIPLELREASASTIAVVTEDPEFVVLVRKAMPAAWTMTGSPEAYATLLWIGTHAPRIVVVDLDTELLHPFEVIRALRGQPTLTASRIIAVGTMPDAIPLARSAGASDTALKHADGSGSADLGRLLAAAE